MKSIFLINVPIKFKKDFSIEISKINVLRAKTVSLAFCIIELLQILFISIARKTVLLDYPNIIYLRMYLFLLITMSVYFVVFSKLAKNVKKNSKKIWGFGISFTYFILIWCGVISMLDQLSSGQAIVYTVAIISIAVTPFFEPWLLFIIYISVHIMFVIFLPYFQKSNTLLFGNYINTTTFIVISWTISRILYKSKSNDFINKLIIREQNKELIDINQKLKKSNQRLKKLSVTDSLTGLYNRRKFNELLNREWDTCKRYSTPISLIMVDIDYFKNFNDIYGHQAGDNCIVKVTSVLSNLVQRASDIVARYGGEEFIIALPHMDSKEAFAFAEKIRTKVESLHIHHGGSITSKYVTISLGVYTVIPSSELSIYRLIRAADKALYKAKADKRNMTVAMDLSD